ncbi:RhoGEF domain [Pelomyxa schiedti]|nr:RhoGEF domain [Pelomyxa schiedti]
MATTSSPSPRGATSVGGGDTVMGAQPPGPAVATSTATTTTTTTHNGVLAHGGGGGGSQNPTSSSPGNLHATPRPLPNPRRLPTPLSSSSCLPPTPATTSAALTHSQSNTSLRSSNPSSTGGITTKPAQKQHSMSPPPTRSINGTESNPNTPVCATALANTDSSAAPVTGTPPVVTSNNNQQHSSTTERRTVSPPPSQSTQPQTADSESPQAPVTKTTNFPGGTSTTAPATTQPPPPPPKTTPSVHPVTAKTSSAPPTPPLRTLPAGPKSPPPATGSSSPTLPRPPPPKSVPPHQDPSVHPNTASPSPVHTQPAPSKESLPVNSVESPRADSSSNSQPALEKSESPKMEHSIDIITVPVLFTPKPPSSPKPATYSPMTTRQTPCPPKPTLKSSTTGTGQPILPTHANQPPSVPPTSEPSHEVPLSPLAITSESPQHDCSSVQESTANNQPQHSETPQPSLSTSQKDGLELAESTSSNTNDQCATPQSAPGTPNSPTTSTSSTDSNKFVTVQHHNSPAASKFQLGTRRTPNQLQQSTDSTTTTPATPPPQRAAKPLPPPKVSRPPLSEKHTSPVTPPETSPRFDQKDPGHKEAVDGPPPLPPPAATSPSPPSSPESDPQSSTCPNTGSEMPVISLDEPPSSQVSQQDKPSHHAPEKHLPPVPHKSPSPGVSVSQQKPFDESWLSLISSGSIVGGAIGGNTTTTATAPVTSPATTEVRSAAVLNDSSSSTADGNAQLTDATGAYAYKLKSRVREMPHKNIPLKQIVRIQALWRGKLARRQYAIIKRDYSLPRVQAYRELLKAERTYNQKLAAIVYSFLLPLQEDKSGEAVIPASDVPLIFGKVQQLYMLHQEVLKLIEDLLDTNYPKFDGVARIFTQIAPRFSVYGVYVQNYQACHSTVEHLSQANSRFAAFLEKASATSYYGLSLNDLMTSPLNHLSNYEMAFQRFVDAIPSTCPAYTSFAELQALVGHWGKVVHESVLKGRRRAAVIEVVRKIGGWSKLLPEDENRQIVSDGDCVALVKKKTKKTSTRHYFVFSDLVLLASRNKKEIGKWIPANAFPWANLRLETNDAKIEVTLIQAEQRVTLRFANDDDKKRFHTQISKILEELARKNKVFGVPLAELIARENAGTGVPNIVTRLTEHLIPSMSTEGLFRLSGSATRVAALRQYIESTPDFTFTSANDPLTCGAVLKAFFRDMVDPLFSFDLYNDFLELDSIVDGPKFVPEVLVLLKQLPAPNCSTLLYLLQFLHQVTELSASNKMDKKNIAIVFAPNVLRPRSDVDIFNMQHVFGVFVGLLTHLDELKAALSS